MLKCVAEWRWQKQHRWPISLSLSLSLSHTLSHTHTRAFCTYLVIENLQPAGKFLLTMHKSYFGRFFVKMTIFWETLLVSKKLSTLIKLQNSSKIWFRVSKMINEAQSDVNINLMPVLFSDKRYFVMLQKNFILLGEKGSRLTSGTNATHRWSSLIVWVNWSEHHYEKSNFARIRTYDDLVACLSWDPVKTEVFKFARARLASKKIRLSLDELQLRSGWHVRCLFFANSSSSFATATIFGLEVIYGFNLEPTFNFG